MSSAPSTMKISRKSDCSRQGKESVPDTETERSGQRSKSSLTENVRKWADKLNTTEGAQWNNYKIPVSYYSQSKDFSEEFFFFFVRKPGEA